MSTGIGKQTLLTWCASMSQSRCSRLEDLKSGVVLLAVLFKVFPKLMEKKLRVRWAPRFDHEVMLNWDSIEQAIGHLRLPSELFDKPGLMAARFRPTYNLLVALYFLQQVSASSDFTADFAHPIEPALASFLQSRAAVESMIAGGAIAAAGAATGDTPTRTRPAPPGSPPTVPQQPDASLFGASPLLFAPITMSPAAYVDAGLDVDAAEAEALAAVATSLLHQPPTTAPSAAPPPLPPSAAFGSARAPVPASTEALFTTRKLYSSASATALPAATPHTHVPLTHSPLSPPSRIPPAGSARRRSTSAEKRRPSNSAGSLLASPRAASAERLRPSRGSPAVVTSARTSAHQPDASSAKRHTHRQASDGPNCSPHVEPHHPGIHGGGAPIGATRPNTSMRSPPRALLGVGGAGSEGASLLLWLKSEGRRLEALLSAVSAELVAARRVHAIELHAARQSSAVERSQHEQLSSAAASAAADAVADARAQCRRELDAELQQVEAEVLEAYGAAVGFPAAEALAAASDDAEVSNVNADAPDGAVFLRRLVAVQSRQMTNLRAQLEELAGRHVAATSAARREHAHALVPAGGGDGGGDGLRLSDTDLREALAARTEEVNRHWQAEVEALRLTLLRLQQQGKGGSAAAGGTTSASGTMVDELLAQNGRLQRAADFLRRRHRAFTAAPEVWTEASPLSGPDELSAARQVQAATEGGADGAAPSHHSDMYEWYDERLDGLLTSTEAIESRAAALFALLRARSSTGGAPAAGAQQLDAGFWQLIAALCVEERRRRVAMRRLRQLERASARPEDDEVSSLAESRVRAQRAELALKVAVAQERGLAGRAAADASMRISLAEARATELSSAAASAEARYGESVRALQASHAAGWKATQRKLGGIEAEARRLKTRDGMWAQLCERQKSLVRALATQQRPAGSAAEQRAVSQLAEEVAAWERSLMRPTAANADADAAAAGSGGEGGGGEGEVARRVDEATAALSAELGTLKEELQQARARQLELAEAAAMYKSQSHSADEQIALANKRCEALHAAGQQSMRRIAALEGEAVRAAREVAAAKKEADSARWVKQMRDDDREVMERLATLAGFVNDDRIGGGLSRSARGGLGDAPGPPPPSRKRTEYYVDSVDANIMADDDDDDDAIADGLMPPMPSRQLSQRSAIYYVQDDDDDGGDVSAELLPVPIAPPPSRMPSAAARPADPRSSACAAACSMPPPTPPGISRQGSAGRTVYYIAEPLSEGEDDEGDEEEGEEAAVPPLPSRCTSKTIYYMEPDGAPSGAPWAAAQPHGSNGATYASVAAEVAAEMAAATLEAEEELPMLWPSRNASTRTEYYVEPSVDSEEEEEEGGEDELGGNGSTPLLPMRARSQTTYYVAGDDDDDDNRGDANVRIHAASVNAAALGPPPVPVPVIFPEPTLPSMAAATSVFRGLHRRANSGEGGLSADDGEAAGGDATDQGGAGRKAAENQKRHEKAAAKKREMGTEGIEPPPATPPVLMDTLDDDDDDVRMAAVVATGAVPSSIAPPPRAVQTPAMGDATAPRVVSCELTVRGKLSKVLFEVHEEDTPSSIALDLMEELDIDASAETLQVVVAQVESAINASAACGA